MQLLAFILLFSKQLSRVFTIIYHHFTDQETEVTLLANDRVKTCAFF